MIIDACVENNTEIGSDGPSALFYFFPFWFLPLFICSVGYLFVLYLVSCYECLRWFYLNMDVSDNGPDRFLPNLLFSYKFYPCFIVILVYISSTFTIWLCIVCLIAAVLLSYTNSFLTRNCHSYRKIVQYEPVKYQIYPLSPLSRHRLSLVRRKVMVLDLDETLIHSHHETGSPGGRPVAPRPTTPPDFILKVTIDRNPVRFFVHKRPHVDFFLDIVSQWYELVVFTASMEIYGAGVADKLDNNRGILRRRYYRQHCTPDLGSYTKDLSAISTDLSNVFILDNSPGAYRAYPDNAIPIKSWFTDPTDTALLNLLPMLDALRFTQDVRSVLSRNLHLHKVW